MQALKASRQQLEVACAEQAALQVNLQQAKQDLAAAISPPIKAQHANLKVRTNTL